eukprot:scaffold30687_cov49-Phaeocystis_antarctica.AAC.3
MALQPTHTTCNPSTQPATHAPNPPPTPRTSGESSPAASTELLPARLSVDLLRRAPRHDAARTVPLPTRAAACRGLSYPNPHPHPNPSSNLHPNPNPNPNSNLNPTPNLHPNPNPKPNPNPHQARQGFRRLRGAPLPLAGLSR